MIEKESQREEESSLIEIEVEEQEEIEVEESETETENFLPEDIPKSSKIEAENTIQNSENSEKKEKHENLDRPYSEIELKIIDIMNGSETINNLLNNNNKWEEKKKGFILLNEYISKCSNKETIIENFESFFNYIQDTLKNFKESNYIILKEGLECIYSLFNVIKTNDNSLNINKKFCNILITELNEKITENKLKNIYIRLINLLMNVYNPGDIINCLIQIINKTNKISLLKEYGMFIKKYLSSNNNIIKSLNAKEIIDFCIKIGNNNNQQLRALSSDIIYLIYDYIGDEYITYIKNNIKESSFKSIEKKIKAINKDENSKKIHKTLSYSLNGKKNSNEINLKNNNDKINILINSNKKEIKNRNRIDISKDITPTLLKYINLGKWKEKKEGIEYIHKILNVNNNHILINGLQELIELIIEKLIDSNKNLVRLIIDLLSHLIESLGAQLKPYTKKIITQLLSNLSGKNNILRQECLSCINKWITIIQNFEIIFILIPPFLLNDNYDMRNELLNMLINNINLIKKDNLFTYHFDDLINSLLYCLQDKSSSIRNRTEHFIQLAIKLIPREDYVQKANQFKPAIEEYLINNINNIYGYKEKNNDIIKENRVRSVSKKRINNFFSPKKKIVDDNNEKDNSINLNVKKNLVAHKISQSIEKKDENGKKSFINYDSKNNKVYRNKESNKKKKIYPYKTCTTTFNKNNEKANGSFNFTAENFHIKKRQKKLKNNVDNTNSNNMNNSITNTSINSLSNNIIASKKIKKINNTTQKPKEKDKNNNSITSNNIPNIEKRVNKFYNTSKKTRDISNLKINLKKKKKEKIETNISNNKGNYKQEINNDSKSNIVQKNRFFSPTYSRRTDLNNNSFQINNNSMNTSQNSFYKRIVNNNLNRFDNNLDSLNKLDIELKGSLFLSIYKIKKDQKEERIDEDRKNSYYFELQNFDQISKIREIMRNIFSVQFIEKIFSDNITSIISCINKIKNYIDNDNDNKKGHILNIEDNLDLILKVIGYKLSNNKSSSFIINTFEFIKSLLLAYNKNNIFLNEIESNILFNILIDKLTNNSNIIKEMSNNILWLIINMIGEEISLLIIMHLIEYKNTKTKTEAINIIITLYEKILGKNRYNFDNWKIKIIKNIMNLYFEVDSKHAKNKLLFIIKDLYSSFNNEIWKYCQNISSENKDELLEKIKESKNNNKSGDEFHTLENEYSDNLNINKIIAYNEYQYNQSNYLLNIINQKREGSHNTSSRKNLSKQKNQLKLNNTNKLKSNTIYVKKIKKIFDNRKNYELNNFHSHNNSNLTDFKKGKNSITNAMNNDIYNNNKNSLMLSKKNINKVSNMRDSSIKKKLFSKHMNTVKNIHENSRYDIINHSKNKIVFMNNNEDINNYNKKMENNNLSQSTVIINNNYNFIKIKSNEIQNKRKEGIIDKNTNNISVEDSINSRNNIIKDSHSKTNYERIKKKISVNCHKNEKFNEIKKILESICIGDKDDMTELILKLHYILYTNYKKNELVIIIHCDYIFNKIIQALNNLLDERKIYTNYIKFISNVLYKICKLGDLISKINIDTQNNLIILTIKTVSLLNSNENDNNYYYNYSSEENNEIVKYFNSIMLRILEYGDINNNINILMNYEKKYRKTNKDIVNYVGNCLINIIKNIKKTYEKIDIGIVVENIYKLLEDLEVLKITSKADKIIMITIKNLLGKLIIYRGDKEFIDYITNSNKTKINNINKKSIFNKGNNEFVKNWLLKYINKINSHWNKISEKNNNNEENDVYNENDNI